MGRHEYYGKISEDTFKTIWNSLSNAISNHKSYIAVKFFMIVYDYFDLIPEITPNFDDKSQVTNEVEVARRLNERQDVIDFISVLGGLLYFNNKLNDVGTIFYYTQSQPPNYKPFLPATIRQCLQLYCKLWTNEHGRYSLIDVKYPFPALVGIGWVFRRDDASHFGQTVPLKRSYNYIKKILLFLFQYSFSERFSFQINAMRRVYDSI